MAAEVTTTGHTPSALLEELDDSEGRTARQRSVPVRWTPGEAFRLGIVSGRHVVRAVQAW